MVEDYTLTTVLALYETAVAASALGRRSRYIEVHDAVSENGRAELSAGRPLSEGAARDLAASLSRERSFDRLGLLPERLLGVKVSGDMVWWRPAGRGALAHESGLSGRAWYPALIFGLLGGKVHVFALARSDRPKAGTRLYKAPLWNMHEDGAVCMGTARVDARRMSAGRAMESVERSFFESTFNNHLSAGRCRSGDLLGLWREVMAGRGKRFPAGELLPEKGARTLGEWMQRSGF
jgi:PRTRC genetic system protein B